MDLEKRARRQSRRVIISEIIMFLAVAATVLVLVFIVSGYWLNSDFEVERQGLLQVSSIPTGANVEIDGTSSWLQRTNTSKALARGEHTIKLTKDGYDTWSKIVNIKEGLLYRIHYPRLFLKERTKEITYDASKAGFSIVSPNHDYMLVTNNTTTWQLLNLDSDKIESKSIDISKSFSFVTLAPNETVGLFNGEIISADWDKNNEHVLFQTKYGDNYEWVLLDTRNPLNSINLTRDFATNFSTVKIYDNSASTLLAIRDGNLHKIDITSRQISAKLIEKVYNFDYLDNEILFFADNNPTLIKAKNEELSQTESNDTSTLNESAQYYIGIIKLGNNEITPIFTTDNYSLVVISKFYDDKYITVLNGSTITLYKKEDLSTILTNSITFNPSVIKVGHDGEFITMHHGNQIASLDMEALSVREWTASGVTFGWLDDDMIYSVADGALSVYDFDGYNERILSNNVSSHFPITITNDKWLYYFSDGNLIRETIN